MRMHFAIKAGFVMAATAFVLACVPGQVQYDAGIQQYRSGNLQDALASLEQAVKEAPANKEYQRVLEEVKQTIITEAVAEADRELASGPPVTADAIRRAQDKLAEARAVNPDDPGVKDLAQKIQQTGDAQSQQIERLYAEAKQHMAAEDYLSANAGFKQVQAADPDYMDTARLLDQTVGFGTQHYYDQARSLFNKDDFLGAEENLKKALTLQADFTPAQQLMERIQGQDKLAYFVQKAKDAVAARNWDEAVGAYERALGYDPDNAVLKEVVRQVRSQAADFYAEQAQSFTNGGWLLKGLENYRLAEKYIGDSQDRRLVPVQRNLATRMASAAGHFKAKEQYGTAWYWCRKINDIAPDHPGLFQLTQTVEDEFKERTKKSVAVFDFSSPSGDSNAGVIFASNLITYLFDNASGDIKIMERENLKAILEEMKLGGMGVISEETAKEMGQVYGIDVAIMGNVLLYKVDTTSSESTKTVRYEVGTRIEDNIEYLNWAAKHPKPSNEELADAPPAKIMAPDYREKDYPVTNHRKVGFVQLSFRIVDIATAQNIQVKTIERKTEVSDETSAGLTEAGILFDPLNIPTDTELLKQMTEEVVVELGLEVLKPLVNLEKTYYQEGIDHLERRDEMRAAESFAHAIMDERMKMIQGFPVTRQADFQLDEIFRNQNLAM